MLLSAQPYRVPARARVLAVSTTQPSHLQISRRATFGGVALTAGIAATLGACRWGPPEEIAPDDDKRDADEALLGVVRRQVAARGTLAEQTATQHVGLATTLAPVIAMHQAHATALGTNLSASDTPPPSPPSPSSSGTATDSTPLAVPPEANAALAQVRAQEAALQTELADGAEQAASGPLARTLASMAAAVAMHLATLPSPRGSAVAP